MQRPNTDATPVLDSVMRLELGYDRLRSSPPIIGTSFATVRESKLERMEDEHRRLAVEPNLDDSSTAKAAARPSDPSAVVEQVAAIENAQSQTLPPMWSSTV